MNKPTPFGKQTFAEYEKEVKEYKAFNLKAKKIELNTVNDISTAIQEGNTGVGEANRLIDNIGKLNADIRAAQSSVSSMEHQLTQVLNADNMLGKVIQDFEFIDKGLQVKIKELGISSNDIKGYSELKSKVKEYTETRKRLNKFAKAGEQNLKEIKS